MSDFSDFDNHRSFVVGCPEDFFVAFLFCPLNAYHHSLEKLHFSCFDGVLYAYI